MAISGIAASSTTQSIWLRNVRGAERVAQGRSAEALFRAMALDAGDRPEEGISPIHVAADGTVTIDMRRTENHFGVFNPDHPLFLHHGYGRQASASPSYAMP